MTLPLDSAGNIMAIEKGTQFRRHFHGRSGAPIIMSGEDAALRPWHEQNVQMKSERSLAELLEIRRTPMPTPPNRQRYRLTACSPVDASHHELAIDDGKPLQN